MYTTSFIEYLRSEKQFSNHTLLAYQKDLDQFGSFLQQNYNLDNITLCSAAMARAWMVELLRQGAESTSVGRKLSSLKSFFRFLMRKGKIDRSPVQALSSPKKPKKLPVFMDEDIMQHLENPLQPDEKMPAWEMQRNKLIPEIFYTTGIRLSELIGLKITDLNLHQQHIRVLGKRKKERLVPLLPETIAQLQNYLEERKEITSPYLFCLSGGKALYPKWVYNLIRKELTAAGAAGKRSPHVLRHTFATHMLNEGADLNAIKEILGHSSLAATQVYTHTNFEKLKTIYKQAHPRA